MPAPEGSDIIYRFGDFELSPRERILKRDGARVSLTPRMFDLLSALVDAGGHLVSKEDLLRQVWADATVEEGNLNRTISALRKALGESRNELKYIETVPKAGYRFIAPVEKENGSRVRPANISAAEISVSDDSIEEVRGPERRDKWPSGLVVAAALAVLVFGGFIAYFFWPRGSNGLSPAAPAATESAYTRLTNVPFDEDSAAWTADDRIRFLRFPAVNKVESMVMNADGSDATRTGTNIPDFRAGTWSPDGKRVMYSKYGAAPRAAFVANADGSGEQQLPFVIGPMEWSPDSTQIVFNTNYPNDAGNSEIFLYSFATGERTNITNNPAFDANPSFSPDGKQIIFNSDRDGNAEIYLMNVDGTGVRRLTNGPHREAFQSFSPDGTQIVFNSNRENEKVGIYLINVNDDSEPVKISDTRFNAEIRPGCWSRDGTKIVFMSDMGGEKFNVYTMTVEPRKASEVARLDDGEIRGAAISPDGSRFALSAKTPDGRGQLRLLDLDNKGSRVLASTENFDLMPAWSPDGKSIAMAMKAEGNTEIFTLNADGTNLQNISRHEGRDGSPIWSPDGTRIIFSSDRDAPVEGAHLFIANPDGSDVRRYSSRNGYEMTPAWSSDGTTIAYACDRADGTSQSLDIVLSDINDPNRERILTTRRFHDSNPAFSPDGRRIAFVSQSDGNFEIYLINTDGSGLIRLTRHIADDIMPTFSPDGTKLYFVSNRSGSYVLYEMGV